jgi:hypothetical protein
MNSGGSLATSTQKCRAGYGATSQGGGEMDEVVEQSFAVFILNGV